MAKTSKKTDPKLWEKVKQVVTAGDKGGRPGQWSARKAQRAVQEYKKEAVVISALRAKTTRL